MKSFREILEKFLKICAAPMHSKLNQTVESDIYEQFFLRKALAQLVNIGHPGIRNITLSFHVKDPEDVVVPRNDPAVLKCPVRSSASANATSARGAAVNVQWLHWDLPLPVDDSRWIVHRDGSLYVPHVAPTGGQPVTGPYRCVVKNEFGVIVSEEAQLQIASLELDDTRENIEVAEQQPVFLPCKAQSVPKATVKWDFNGQTLPQDLSYVPLPSGALLILKTLPSHAGLYRCTVTNSVLGISKNKTVNLTVLAPLNDEQTVTIIPISLNSTATMGMNISLYCVATGWPLPKVEWKSDNVVVGNSSILELSANRTSTGAYECLANNGESSASQMFHLTVQQRPYFITPPKSYSYTSPSTVKLECRAGGFPRPCTKWLKDGKPVRLNERIRKDASGSLVIIHSFSYDKGIYQCVATNSAGSARSVSQVVLTSSAPPPPPVEMQCRSYDERSICVTWKVPPNVRALAYSIYVYFNNTKTCRGNCRSTSHLSGCDDEVPQEEFGPEYVVISGNSHLADRLNASTNYTFYIRLYSRATSDDSNRVSCITAVKGERNLRFKWVNSNTLELIWSNVSSDIPCGSSNANYMVQWKRNNHPLVNTSNTENLKHNISGLIPSLVYHFRVMSSSYRLYDSKWTAVKMPDEAPPSNNTYVTPQGDVPQEAPPNPNGFKVTNVSAKSVVLKWLPQPSDYAKSYIVCYVELTGGIFNAFTLTYENAQQSNETCVEANAVVSLNNMMQVDHLKPNTLYEFRIQSVNSDGLRLSFASPLTIRTHPDVPSTVLDLKYVIINESTACLTWLPPAYINGVLNNYTILYTSNSSRPIEEWNLVTLPATKGSNLSCTSDDDRVSILLVNLKKTEEYTIIVRARSSVGLGFPNMPCLLKFSNKKRETDAVLEYQEYMTEKQKMGVIGGCILALACIACCVSCIAYRRRCVKQRHRTHLARLTAGSYRPARARYASQGASSHVRLEAPCPVTHETQNLVTVDEDSAELPSSKPPVHLDTKGKDDYPRDHINGMKKPSMNGHLLNGHVHITENPQFDRKEKNGDVRNNSNNKKSPQYTIFHDDPNSNRIQSPVHKHSYTMLDPPSPGKRNRCSPIYTNGTGLFNGHKDDDAFPFRDREVVEKAHARYAEDPFVVGNHRRISPMVAPNG
ncbi:hypothetical protein WA026_011522 [Henosepilachna vigintioctopunctata]|uniref:Protogenin n=1 Tax=Henosepilachna vigintioctopunctata TaxID=420089 RepID=A0AAW1TS22_9CUCU